ncbi:uncharacterized protein isoform X2 [Choristoneura fumiferana]|uniref:uncharacterized protein isoform X2 n=1 Tax=Choristoneura fumiferana TaxID=7141 RepID=UPI003D158457
MASKIVLFVLVVTIYKAKTSTTASTSSSNAQSASNTQATSQSQTYPAQSSNPNQGIKASSQLQLVPGQKFNLQAIPVSQVQGSVQQKGQYQNSGYSIPIPRPSVQVSPTPQIQTSPAQLIQPSLTGPASVITSPVSSITIPPSTSTTVFDHSLCNSLANALQMMIANEFINSAINNNIIKEGIQIPVVETVVPTFDLATFLKGLNAQQAPSQPETPQSDTDQYDWTAIQNFLNKQGQDEKPVTEATAPTDVANLRSYYQQYGQTAKQINQQQTNSQNTPQVTDSQTYSPQQAVTDNQSPQAYPSQTSYDSALETLAAYFGCNVSDLSSNSYPSVPQIAFPEEIPAQLICNYGYMPTAVPVVSFSVQPLNAGDSNFIVGCKC